VYVIEIMTGKPKSGVYAGSFDPVTKGHMDIILQAALLLDRLYVVVGVNPGKSPLFTPEERLEMIREEIDRITKPALKAAGKSCDIKVEKHTGLTATFMKAHDAPYYVRGLRRGTEFDDESSAVAASRLQYGEFTPVFLCSSDAKLQDISSTAARELARFDGKGLEHYVSPAIEARLKKRIDERGLRIK
jgi:pantetheine-phosphate adenylyltransferase